MNRQEYRAEYERAVKANEWPDDEPIPTLADLELLTEGWIYLGNGAWKRRVKLDE